MALSKSWLGHMGPWAGCKYVGMGGMQMSLPLHTVDLQVAALAKRLSVVESSLQNAVLDDFKLLLGSVDVKVGGCCQQRAPTGNNVHLSCRVHLSRKAMAGCLVQAA